MKGVTFSPCSDIRNKQLIWAMYSNGKYLAVSSASLISRKYAEEYSKEIKVKTVS